MKLTRHIGLAILALLGPVGSGAVPVPIAMDAVPSAAAASAVTVPASLKPDPAKWERLKQAAKGEGRVIVTGPGFPGLRNGIVQGFHKAYGISVEYLGLRSGEAITRIIREARAGNVTIDVAIGGVSTCWPLAERGLIDEVTTLLVDPEILRPSVWRGGGLKLIRPSPNLPKDFFCGIQTAEWVMTDLFVNRNIVRPDAIRSWKDLLKPEFRGKISSYDPRFPGSAQTTVAYLYTLFGAQYLKDLYVGQKVALTSDYRQHAEWVARGTYPIGIALVQAAVEPLRKEGLPLERAFPVDGQGALTGGFGTLFKIKGGPHPNAAAVFLNWWASREAQEMYEREMMETSLRSDMPHKVPEYVVPKAAVEYRIDDYNPDYFFAKRVPAIAKIQEILGR